MANGFLGAETILTSTENHEVVPETPSNWTWDKYSFYKFSFINYDPCTIKINGGEPIYLKELQGFESSERDVKINSFVIVESGIEFSWLGAY